MPRNPIDPAKLTPEQQALLAALPVIGQGQDPMAEVLKAQMSEAHNHRPIKVKSDGKGNLVEDRPPPVDLVFTPFPDGVLFKATPNQKKSETGTWLICDASGLNVALVIDEHVADIFCKGAHLIYQEAQAQIKAAEESAEAAKKVAETLAAPVAPEPHNADEPCKVVPLPEPPIEPPYTPLD